jgi:DNA-binding MarR family transcriptional regulator
MREPRECQLLRSVGAADRRRDAGRLVASPLAEALLIPRPSITVYVRRLEAAQLLKREIDGSDLRPHELSLTSEDRKVMTRGLALLSEAFVRRLGRLTATQQSELKSLLEKLR